MQRLSNNVAVLIISSLSVPCLFSPPCAADPASEFDHAKQLHASRSYAEAIQVLNAVAAADQALAPAAKWLVGICYRETKDYPAAVSALTGALAICGANTTLYVGIKDQLAVCYMALQDWAKALPVLQDLLTKRPGKAARCWYEIGTCYRELGQDAQAIDAWKRVVDVPAFRKGAINQLAICYFDSKDWSNALPAFQTVLAECPDQSALCWHHIGTCHRELKQYAQAIDALGKAVGDSIFGHDATNQLSVCYEEIGDAEKSRAALQTLLTGYPDDAAGLKLRLALSYLKTHDYEQARIQFAGVLNDHPEDPLAKCSALCVAGCMSKLGRADDALAFLDDLRNRRPDMRQDVLLGKAEILFTYSKRKDDALALINGLESEQLSGSLSREVRRAKAMVLLADPGKSSISASILDGLISEAPNDPSVQEWKFYRTMCFVSDQNWSSARAAFSEFCTEYPTSGYYARAKYHEGDCCVQLHNVEDAEMAFSEVANRFPSSGWAQAASGRLRSLGAIEQAPGVSGQVAEVSQ